ncbi:2-succinyl-5-enolpyruvyl-6-hydroxy-3-cyclohexene-1-carboxylic-acid synthase [Vibrio sp. TH_r3]|uniref:2-succinyl-5-enolpyruvyl-6-hydroxy-3- cyclohexene-1-carboxylic-acid synthase n=1 Tax=Vibrio sp. TH_r3 TaxID=3082084 RepID=UPI0029555BAD|nr:2-succinyl-5-enolpyruvyl-6-hydroxy-3-cyclohexene-1-carboxylic-acid synthase [Vibrio sp. TH_r3]MDV7103999.1 2-succinyl-5-enolpyruvyl-6-hydroxy-3-cyclohexene-1-carboxylic-acid synthase [Vibrio sp. TH_r3]
MSQLDQHNEQNQARLNRLWSKLILEELTRLGVQHVCVAPGSRSTPLTLEADEQENLILHTHFDERGLGFLALGLAKASLLPVAIIVTSGTAVANLLPAIAEAKLTGEKLVVLTADRPPELIDCGANQAISQIGIYSEHVTSSLNLPVPSEAISAEWLLSSTDNLLFQQRLAGGPVHINCPFAEPLYLLSDCNDGNKANQHTAINKYDDLTDSKKTAVFYRYLRGVQAWLTDSQPYTKQVNNRSFVHDDATFLAAHKGLIIIGSVDLAEAEKALALGKALRWPILCDPQSGVSSEWQHYDLWLRNQRVAVRLASCDFILQFGARLVSKSLNGFIHQQVSSNKANYTLVSNQQQRLNPNSLPQTHIHANIVEWVNNQLAHLASQSSTHQCWADELKQYASRVKSLLWDKEIFPSQSNSELKLSEINLAALLETIANKTDLFIGNSLIVRLIDMVSALKGNRTYSNRGASGIDGLVATAAGVQRINNEAMLLLLGDISLLYDLNSLALYHHSAVPTVILVTNNDGGAIFDLLPVPTDKKQALYQMPHGYQFEHAARQFNLKYLKPDSLQQLMDASVAHLQSGSGALVIELLTPAGQASQDIQRLVQKIHAFC